MILSGSWDKLIKLWNITDGTVIRNFTGHSNDVNYFIILNIIIFINIYLYTTINIKLI
jgi:WD40 repeat protein